MTRYAFANFELDTERIEIKGPAGQLTFEPQVFDVLQYLIEAEGRLVTKMELLDNVWGDRFVSESALTTRIKQIRRLLGDDGRTQWAVKTVHGKGYRFLPDVTATQAPVTAADGDQGLPRDLVSEDRQVFVGRRFEMHRALSILDRPDRDSMGWIWLLGEPGIGKTYMAAHLAHLGHQQGARVLFGRCNEDLAVPYQPVIEALRAATQGLAGDSLTDVLGPFPNELVRLLPELPERLPDLALPTHADTDTERYRLFEGVMGWLDTASAHEPVVLVIDDAHWATQSTLQLLDHINRSQLATGTTMVITARDTAPDENPELSDLIAKGQGVENQAVIRLGGLQPGAVQELLAHHASDPDDARLDVFRDYDVGAVVQQTAGNPLLIRALGSTGGVDLRSAVRRRLTNLQPQVQQTLTVASIIGLEFDANIVAHASHRDQFDVLDDLEHAVAARLLVDVRADRFRFVHALVRASLREEVTSGRRARWHARIGAAIQDMDGASSGDRTIALAHHFAEASANDPSLRPVAVGHLRRAAAQASAQLSFVDSAAHLDKALGLSAESDLLLRAELAIGKGDAQKSAGLSLVALQAYDHAFADACCADDGRLTVAAALRYEDASWRPGRFGGPAVERLRIAEEKVDPADAESRARIQIGLTRALAMCGDITASRAAWQKAAQLITRIGDVEIEVQGLNAHLANMIPLEWGADDRSVLLDRLAQIAPQVKDVEESNLARQVQLSYLLRQGRMHDYRQLQEELRDATRQLHSRFWDYILANHYAMLALYEGNLSEAADAAEVCLSLAQHLVDEDNSGLYGLRMFLIRREQQRLSPLVPVLRQLASSDDSTGFWSPGLALLLAETGNRDAAMELFEGFSKADFDIPRDAMWSTVMTMFIELAVSLGDPDACKGLYDRFSADSAPLVVTGASLICFGSSDRYLGMLALTFGDLQLAETHLLKAIDIDARNGSVLWTTHAQLWLARLRKAQGRDADAAALAGDVARVGQARGYAALQADAQALL